MKDCPVPDCTRTASSGMLMCRSHWYKAPKPLRDEVWRTWKAVTGSGPGLRIERVQAYRAAADAAIEAAT